MEDQLPSLIQKAVTEGLRAQWSQIVILTLISGAIGAYVGAYLKIKGANLAKHEDLAKAIEAIKAKNQAIEEIKADNAQLLAFNQTRGQQLATEANFRELLEQQRQLMTVQTQVQQEIQSGFAMGLEQFKWERQVELEFKKGVMEPRRMAYFKLWALLEPLRASGEADLAVDERNQLVESLRSWYHKEAGGAMLSLAAGSLFVPAVGTLEDPYDKEKARGAFSDLRTQLKVDLGVYSPDEAKVPIVPRVNASAAGKA